MNQECDTIAREKVSYSYNQNKRQIYVWVENKEFFDNLRNKSKFINLLIKKYRTEVGELTEGGEIEYGRET